MKYWTRLSWLRNSKRIVSAALAAAAISAAFLYIRARACGPDWAPDVFIPEHHPSSPKLYGDGRLGILQPGYFHTELVVAYRYLSGGKLSDAEKAIYLPKPEPPTDTKALGGEVPSGRGCQAGERLDTGTRRLYQGRDSAGAEQRSHSPAQIRQLRVPGV